MNKLDLLKSRRSEVLAVGADIRKKIAALVDPDSFAEFDSYSFSENEFYEGTVGGEGVVTGTATINDNLVFIVAQNSAVLSGGVTEANCRKITKCQDKALRASAPIVYLFDSLGVAVGEGVKVLEGIASVLSYSNALKGESTQIAVTVGDLYGSFALVAANCDFNFVVGNAAAVYASPLVISAADGKALSAGEIGGVASASKTGAVTFAASDLESVSTSIKQILDTLPMYNGDVETMDDFNRAAPALNEKACAKCVIDAVFDKDYFMELNAAFAPEVKTALARLGGIAVGALVFDGGEKGVELDLDNVKKIKEFVYFCDENDLPLVILTNTLGIKADLKTALSPILKETANLSYALCNFSAPVINVVYGKAVGLGYTLFASKAMGADYSFAFATAKISLFDTDKGAMLELAGVNENNHDAAEEKYADENQDPFNAARYGSIDDIIEPQFVRPRLIHTLQILTR